MRAHVGDRLVIRGHRAGDPSRTAEVLEAHGADDGPPYLVRWDDSHESLLVPSSDVMVRPREPEPAAAATVAESVGEVHTGDPEVRMARLEEGVDAMRWQLERIREDLRALAAAVREPPAG